MLPFAVLKVVFVEPLAVVHAVPKFELLRAFERNCCVRDIKTHNKCLDLTIYFFTKYPVLFPKQFVENLEIRRL